MNKANGMPALCRHCGASFQRPANKFVRNSSAAAGKRAPNQAGMKSPAGIVLKKSAFDLCENIVAADLTITVHPMQR